MNTRVNGKKLMDNGMDVCELEGRNLSFRI